ncbi:MAG: hypothetical protein HC781_02550 [Leptolyngbyaceae cyanobacterium CSU_1_4]|nr:hypothetical protein [Leptolyngbyaceae cyanobacterium CSU_1_4]
MNHTENRIAPNYLAAERLRLLDWIAMIQASSGKRLTAKPLGRPGSDPCGIYAAAR